MNQYKYLGITLDSALSLDCHVKKVNENIKNRAKLLASKIYELDTSIKIILW